MVEETVVTGREGGWELGDKVGDKGRELEERREGMVRTGRGWGRGKERNWEI